MHQLPSSFLCKHTSAVQCNEHPADARLRAPRCCGGNSNWMVLCVGRLSFGTVVGTMNKLANAMENGEFDFDGTHDKKVG